MASPNVEVVASSSDNNDKNDSEAVMVAPPPTLRYGTSQGLPSIEVKKNQSHQETADVSGVENSDDHVNTERKKTSTPPPMQKDANSSTTFNDGQEEEDETADEKDMNPPPPPMYDENQTARQWLFDRTMGVSKYGNSRPPCPMCWVPPCVGFCPGVLEDNRFCKVWGRFGLVNADNERARSWIILIGSLANLIGFVLTFYSAFAISTDFDILRSTSFSRTILTSDNFEHSGEESMQIDVGLRASAWSFPHRNEELVVEFGELCELPREAFGTFLTTAEDQCGACAEVSQSMVISVIISTITYIPTLSTNVLRWYSNYDVNCQKGFATIVASITLILSLSTLNTYNKECFGAFYEGDLPLNEEFEYTSNPDEVLLDVNFQWKMGPGLVCLTVGTVLKAIDIACNLMVPSPTITRDHKEQWEYEHLIRENNDVKEEQEAPRPVVSPEEP